MNWYIFPAGSDIAWTLGAELTFYLIAPFLLRSLERSIICLVLSFLLRLSVWKFTGPNNNLYIIFNYFFLPSTLFFFLLGHLARFIGDTPRYSAVLGYLALPASLALSTYMIGMGFDNVYLYISAALFAFSLPAIFGATKDNPFSNFLGDLTYPLYLIGNILLKALFAEWSGPIAQFGTWLLASARQVHDPQLRATFIGAMITILALGVAIAVRYFIERPAIAILRRCLDGAMVALNALRRMSRDLHYVRLWLRTAIAHSLTSSEVAVVVGVASFFATKSVFRWFHVRTKLVPLFGVVNPLALIEVGCLALILIRVVMASRWIRDVGADKAGGRSKPSASEAGETRDRRDARAARPGCAGQEPGRRGSGLDPISGARAAPTAIFGRR
jgi:hypothetical protein